MIKNSVPNSGRQSIKVSQQVQKQQQLMQQRAINYTQLRTLKGKYNSDLDRKSQHQLLPGLKNNSKKSLFNKNPKLSHSKQQNQNQKQQPKLLTSALCMLKRRQQHQLEQNIQLNPTQRIGGISHYFDSRQITPINPLLGSNLHQNNNNSSYVSKKRIGTHQTNKSRLQSITSELYDVDSGDEENQQTNHVLQPAYKMQEFKLYDHVLGQSEAVFQYSFGKPRKVNPKLIYIWKECLYHQDKTQIYVPINPEEPIKISYTHPRVFPLNQLEKGFQQVYGSGKHRCLKAGQQSLIIQGIRKYLKKCDQEPMKIARKDFDIISDILIDTKLTQLQNYPMCYKQIEGHLKIMCTRWKYDNIGNKSNKTIQSAIINGKNNFVELGKPGILAEFLLKHSNMKQLQ